MTKNNDHTALIIVDIQNDFVNGSLATDPDEKYVAKVSEWIENNKNDYPLIITTQDWHVSDNTEHIEQWGEHCMANTPGAEIHREVLRSLRGKNKSEDFIRFYKGHHDHGYSGFEGVIKGADINSTHPDETLAGFLKDRSIRTVHIVGIATDHCVRATAVDAADNGFETVVLSEYVNGVSDEESNKLINGKFQEQGVKVV